MQPGEVLVRFLESIGRRSEAAAYLSLFRAEDPESFAIIAVDEAVMAHDCEALVVDLLYLAGLGLRPVVVLGLLAPASDDGAGLAERLGDKVAVQVTRSADQASRGARAGELPVLVLAQTAKSLEERFARLGQVAAALKTRKIVFLGESGGISPHGGPYASLVDLTTEYEGLMAPGVLSEPERVLVSGARTLIDRVPHRMTIAVTSPLQLLRELFTVRGAGTLLRRGATIRRYYGYTQVQRRRLDAVMQSAFGAVPAEEFYRRPVTQVCVAGDYAGAAIVSPTTLAPYLTKFAVDRLAQGEGIGRDLWQALKIDHPSLIWRSRADNDINSWYQQQCEGMARFDPWYVYWRNLPAERIPEAIDIVLSKPMDFAIP